MTDFFQDIPAVTYVGPNSDVEYGFRHYNRDEVILGKRMEDHLRFAVAWWHSFAWEGGDPFGGQTFQRPWHPQDSMKTARIKADAAFEMFRILGVPFYCWHDADVRPETGAFADNLKTLNDITDYMAGAPPICSATAAGWRGPRPTLTPRCSPLPPPR